MAPADIAVLLDRIAELSAGLTALTLQSTRDREELRREIVVNRDEFRRALHGGNGDGAGIYEKLRVLIGWKRDHESTHKEQNVERRRKGEDLKSGVAGFAKDIAKIVVSALVALAMFKATGQIPPGVFQ